VEVSNESANWNRLAMLSSMTCSQEKFNRFNSLAFSGPTVVGEKGYEVWALAADEPGAISGQFTGFRTFGCAVAWDAQNQPVDVIAAFSNQLISAGCAFIGFWGPGCERVHDIFDEEEVGDGSGPMDAPIIVTTWHENESWPDTLDFLMDLGAPVKSLSPGCHDLIILSLGSQEWTAQAELHVAQRKL
jgi:hypothetical protein